MSRDEPRYPVMAVEGQPAPTYHSCKLPPLPPLPSQGKTRAALLHTDRLIAGTCHRCRASIALLHAWAEAAGCKAHTLSQPPGIGWTVAGTMLWQLDARWDAKSDEERLEGLLTSLAALLRSDGVPSIALDAPPFPSRRRGVCDTPLCIWLGETNLCDRMTVKTTRALLALVEGALALPPPDRLQADAYGPVRAACVPLAAVVRPLRTGAVPRTLHNILRSLDAYEVVVSVFVTMRADGCICIHALVDPAADAQKYGLQPAQHEAVVDFAAGSLRLSGKRNAPSRSRSYMTRPSPTRVWSVLAHRAPPPQAPVRTWRGRMSCSGGSGSRRGGGEAAAAPESEPKGESMALWWRFEARPGGEAIYAPNAAHLTVDLLSRFEPSWWRAAT